MLEPYDFTIYTEPGPHIGINWVDYMCIYKNRPTELKKIHSYTHWLEYMLIHISVLCLEIYNLKLRIGDRKY